MKIIFGIWQEKVPSDVLKRIESKLHEMKKCDDSDLDLRCSEIIAYDLIKFVRKRAEDRVCQIMLLLEVMHQKEEIDICIDKDLYFEIETMIMAIDKPLQSVLINLLNEVKK